MALVTWDARLPCLPVRQSTKMGHKDGLARDDKAFQVLQVTPPRPSNPLCRHPWFDLSLRHSRKEKDFIVQNISPGKNNRPNL